MEEKKPDSNSPNEIVHHISNSSVFKGQEKANEINTSSIEKSAKALLGGVSVGTLLGSAMVTLIGTPLGISVGAGVGLVTTIVGVSNALNEATEKTSQKEQS